MNNPNEMYSTLDAKIAEFDRAIEASTEMIEGMKAQRGLLVALRDTVSTLELNDFAQRARAEEFLRGMSDPA